MPKAAQQVIDKTEPKLQLSDNQVTCQDHYCFGEVFFSLIHSTDICSAHAGCQALFLVLGESAMAVIVSAHVSLGFREEDK